MECLRLRVKDQDPGEDNLVDDVFDSTGHDSTTLLIRRFVDVLECPRCFGKMRDWRNRFGQRRRARSARRPVQRLLASSWNSTKTRRPDLACA
jgi:hypothetical protein